MTAPDAGTLDVLSRLQLTAVRRGSRVRLSGARRELRELIDLAGLAEILAGSVPLPVEVEGQTEHREEPGRVEEEADPADPPA